MAKQTTDQKKCTVTVGRLIRTFVRHTGLNKSANRCTPPRDSPQQWVAGFTGQPDGRGQKNHHTHFRPDVYDVEDEKDVNDGVLDQPRRSMPETRACRATIPSLSHCSLLDHGVSRSIRRHRGLVPTLKFKFSRFDE